MTRRSAITLAGGYLELAACANMQGKTETPASVSTAVLYNGIGVELLIGFAVPETGAIHSSQFLETRPDKGEYQHFKTVDWGRTAAPGAVPIVPECGHVMERVGEYWMAWRKAAVLSAAPAETNTPASVPLADGEKLIDRPLVVLSKEMHAYTWRGSKLLKHRFRPGGAPVLTEEILTLDYEPLLSRSAAVPGDENDMAVIGVAGLRNGKIAATVLLVRGDKAVRADGVHDGPYRPFEQQQIAVHAGMKFRPAITLLGVDKDGGYALLEAQFEPSKRECVWTAAPLAAGKNHLKSAAAYYYKSQNSPRSFLVAVDKSGTLLQPRADTVQIVREDVGDRYSFPILVTRGSRYEATGAGESIKLNLF